ncbi:MAG: AraC family transcriptional regulator ligand-binding domain-containing protein [Caulobacteraceae bacterium]
MVGGAVNVLRWLIRRDWRPERVGFTHAAWGDLDRYRPYFGRTPQFDQDRLHFVVRRADMDITLPGHDPEAERLLRQLAEQQLPDTARPFSRAVARTISHRLAEGAVTAEGVAGALDLDLRTLQRRLSSEGSSFSDLLNGVRKDLARTYVESSRRPPGGGGRPARLLLAQRLFQWYSRAHGHSAAVRRATDRPGRRRKS